jgi:hypothetical protein
MNVAARFDPTEPMRERVRRPYARNRDHLADRLFD